MSTASTCLIVDGIDVDVFYKEIKNLHIGVYPPTGRVRVAAPERLGDDQVRVAVIRRLPWIRRQQERLQSARRHTVREMVTGESHYVWGTRLRLKVTEQPGRAHIEVRGSRLQLYVPEGTAAARRRELLDLWYRRQLKEEVPALVTEWESKLGVVVQRWSIRRMKTKWGSCNHETGHIWFNIELATKHPSCLEYLIAHEMTHLIERGHGPRFELIMDTNLPDWRSRRDILNRSPLEHQEWRS